MRQANSIVGRLYVSYINVIVVIFSAGLHMFKYQSSENTDHMCKYHSHISTVGTYHMCLYHSHVRTAQVKIMHVSTNHRCISIDDMCASSNKCRYK